MRLRAILAFHALSARTDRQEPIGAHLKIVIERLHRAIIEGVARLLALRAPDQSLMGVGEAGPAEVRHRVRLAPDNIVQNPEVGVLEQRSDAVDVVIAADYPDRAVVLQDPARLFEPVPGEVVVDRETVELVPLVVARIDLAAFRTEQVATELKIVRRVGEN